MILEIDIYLTESTGARSQIGTFRREVPAASFGPDFWVGTRRFYNPVFGDVHYAKLEFIPHVRPKNKPVIEDDE